MGIIPKKLDTNFSTMLLVGHIVLLNIANILRHNYEVPILYQEHAKQYLVKNINHTKKYISKSSFI
jgi:hypothetical protein